MNDFGMALAISWKIIESLLLSLIVAGSIYLCIIYFFEKRDEEGRKNEKARIEFERKAANFTKNLILPLAILIFIGLFGKTPIIGKMMLILTAGSISASNLAVLLKKAFGLEKEGEAFWVLFIIFYCVIMYILIGEIIK